MGDDGYSRCVQEEIDAARHFAVKDERERIASHLNRLAQSEAGNTQYLRALDDVAATMGLNREEKVTYSA